MNVDHCTWCGAEITAEGVGYKSRLFCSDECCEEYQNDLEKNGEPNPEELEKDFIVEDLESFDYGDDGEISDDDEDLDLVDDF